jgi:hypothetical protein
MQTGQYTGIQACNVRHTEINTKIPMTHSVRKIGIKILIGT